MRPTSKLRWPATGAKKPEPEHVLGSSLVLALQAGVLCPREPEVVAHGRSRFPTIATNLEGRD